MHFLVVLITVTMMHISTSWLILTQLRHHPDQRVLALASACSSMGCQTILSGQCHQSVWQALCQASSIEADKVRMQNNIVSQVKAQR